MLRNFAVTRVPVSLIDYTFFLMVDIAFYKRNRDFLLYHAIYNVLTIFYP